MKCLIPSRVCDTITITYDNSDTYFLFDWDNRTLQRTSDFVNFTTGQDILMLDDVCFNDNMTDVSDRYFQMYTNEILVYYGDSLEDFKDKFPEYLV